MEEKAEKIGEEARRIFPVLPRFFFFFCLLPFSPNAELGPKLLSLNKPADTVRRISVVTSLKINVIFSLKFEIMKSLLALLHPFPTL